MNTMEKAPAACFPPRVYNGFDWRRESQPASITSSARSHTFCGWRQCTYRRTGDSLAPGYIDTGPLCARPGVSAGSGTMSEHFTYIGQKHGWGDEVPFGISTADQRQHIYLIGKTGSGKSTLLRNLIVQHIAAGHGVGLIDPHGDLAEE